MNDLSKESDELLYEELQIFRCTSVQKPLVEELYRRTNLNTIFQKDNFFLALEDDRWNYSINGIDEEWREYPVELPELVEDAFQGNIWTIRLYEYHARIIQLEKELAKAKLNIDKGSKMYLQCMILEKQLEEYRGTL